MQSLEILLTFILHHYFLSKRIRFTQSELHSGLGISLGMVNRRIKELEELGGVEISQRSFRLLDSQKLLTILATQRRFSKEIQKKIHTGFSVKELESSMPPEAVFSGCSAYRLLFNDSPSDYSEVLVYGGESVSTRFKEQQGSPDLIILKSLPLQLSKLTKKSCVPIPLLYADLWNQKGWQAKEYRDALERRLFE